MGTLLEDQPKNALEDLDALSPYDHLQSLCDRYGYDDGDDVPGNAEAMRAWIIRAINESPLPLRAEADDNSGIHNNVMITLYDADDNDVTEAFSWNGEAHDLMPLVSTILDYGEVTQIEVQANILVADKEAGAEVERCFSPDIPDMWSVYFRHENGLAAWVQDFDVTPVCDVITAQRAAMMYAKELVTHGKWVPIWLLPIDPNGEPTEIKQKR